MSDMNNEFEQLLEESLVTIHNGRDCRRDSYQR